MWSYSCVLLKSFSGLSWALGNTAWRRLVNLNIASCRPTRRGCRAGSNKVRSIKSIISSRTEGKLRSIEQSMRIMPNKFVCQKPLAPSRVSFVLSLPHYYITGGQMGANLKNLTYIKCQNPCTDTEQRVSLQFVPSLLLTNVMSLAPKIDKICSFVKHADLDLLCITETWLRNTISDNIIQIPNYNVVRKDQESGSHGGVCVFVHHNIHFNNLVELQSPNLEVIWIKIRPRRLPRSISCIIVGIIYHPPNSNNSILSEYLSECLTTLEGDFPNCGIILTGDFNQFNTSPIARQFKFKQLIKFPTRGNNTLDKILTNLHSFYKDANCLSPFGLLDHCTITIFPKERIKTKSERIKVLVRDRRPSKKEQLGRFLSGVNWSSLSVDSVEIQAAIFNDLIQVGLNNIMPEKTRVIHRNDAPWMTTYLKELIVKRQAVWAQGNQMLFKFYRNRVNRHRKRCRQTYYNSKIRLLKDSKPKRWWDEVKRISGHTPMSDNKDLLSILALENMNINDSSHDEIANFINDSFLDPQQSYVPLDESDKIQYARPASGCDVLQVQEIDVFMKLKSLNASQSPGPDGHQPWLLREFAEILVFPISLIINNSFQQETLPLGWKQSNITPIPKACQITNVNKHLRPISLTPIISKVAEEFVLERQVRPAILEIIDQFGVVPKSSTTMALISMIHRWAQATDQPGNLVRTVLFDFRKAFDLIDHKRLSAKIRQLNLPPYTINWILDFLTGRMQRVKLRNNCFSQWSEISAGVPQGTKLGPWLYVLMINDLTTSHSDPWKFVNDTTISEILKKGQRSTIQLDVDDVQNWTITNLAELNEDKSK
ncbi:uncharacterized protein LOC114518590 [Dendronephthya gigantea]|uniref:uncharacterized protein LOC114518590 n=1 Tax=Dendronephthya gigantea TaxID=151771 RepID=UPI00106950CD|nr:uncharacterized protein LOC114518590 [Dendronephthya gigantea]